MASPQNFRRFIPCRMNATRSLFSSRLKGRLKGLSFATFDQFAGFYDAPEKSFFIAP
jgi:hypothetical protein